MCICEQVDAMGARLLARLHSAWDLSAALRSLRGAYLLLSPALQGWCKGLIRHLQAGTPLHSLPRWELQDLAERSLAAAAEGLHDADLPETGRLEGAFLTKQYTVQGRHTNVPAAQRHASKGMLHACRANTPNQLRAHAQPLCWYCSGHQRCCGGGGRRRCALLCGGAAAEPELAAGVAAEPHCARGRPGSLQQHSHPPAAG